VPIAVHARVWAGAKQGLFELVPEHCQAFRLGVEMFMSKFAGLAHADDRRHILRACPSSVLLVPANKIGMESRSFPYIERPDAFGRVDLMPGQRKYVYSQFVHIERKFAGCLDRVGMEKDPLLSQDIPELGDGKDHACFIVRVHD
jgi:hypothetical protein